MDGQVCWETIRIEGTLSKHCQVHQVPINQKMIISHGRPFDLAKTNVGVVDCCMREGGDDVIRGAIEAGRALLLAGKVGSSES